MIQFTLPPTATAIPVSMTGNRPASEPNFEDLRAHVATREDLSAKTRESYLGAIDEVAEKLNKPLGMIPVSLEEFDERFPLKGFDAADKPTEEAYQTWRRRVRASLKEFLGIHAKQARLRAQLDEWTELFDAVEPLTKGKSGQAKWHAMKLSGLRTFALVSRAFGWQPRDLDLTKALEIEESYSGNKREANRRALARLDELRAFPGLLHLLPPQPIGFTAAVRQAHLPTFNPVWESQFMPWIAAITKTGWDPVAQAFSDDHKGYANTLRFALRCTLRIGEEQGLLASDADDIRPLLEDNTAVRAIAAEMFARKDRPKSKGRLAPRTSRKYLKALRHLRAHLGIDVSELTQIIANNKVSREGKKAEKEMTPKNRRFCEALINKKPQRNKFLFSFNVLRAAAEEIIAGAKSAGRPLTGIETAEVRMLGVTACFAAIEIGGSPIRVEDAMALPCIGEDAQIRIPKKGRKPIQVFIPVEFTKNNAPIEFTVRYSRHGYHKAIQWYLNEIRPLFPHSATSRYLFPAVTNGEKHLDEGYFGERFTELMRSIVKLPMTPHQMRHGQVSLLLNAHPNEIEVIAKRIDDTVGTLRQFYGWIDALRLVERGQDLLIGLMDD